MNEIHHLSAPSSSSHVPGTHCVSNSGDETTAEVLALREARQRAVEARLDAERALHEAEQAEARLLAQEEQAMAAAMIARRDRATEAARLAAENERGAFERVAHLEVEFQRCSEAKMHVETAARSVMQSRDEAQRALDRLTASLSEFEDRLRDAEENERRVDHELTASRLSAQQMTRVREQAVAAIPTFADHASIVEVEIAATVSAPAAVWPTPASTLPSGLEAERAQRVAERRAADAARAQRN